MLFPTVRRLSCLSSILKHIFKGPFVIPPASIWCPVSDKQLLQLWNSALLVRFAIRAVIKALFDEVALCYCFVILLAVDAVHFISCINLLSAKLCVTLSVTVWMCLLKNWVFAISANLMKIESVIFSRICNLLDAFLVLYPDIFVLVPHHLCTLKKV